MKSKKQDKTACKTSVKKFEDLSSTALKAYTTPFPVPGLSPKSQNENPMGPIKPISYIVGVGCQDLSEKYGSQQGENNQSPLNIHSQKYMVIPNSKYKIIV